MLKSNQMVNDILFALWFFFPAGLANVAPILAAQAPLLKRWNTPMDLGHSYKGKRLLGNHKTWRGIAVGAVAGIVAVWLQVYFYENHQWVRDISQNLNYSQISVIGLGVLLSLGALGGDALKSLLKRRSSVGDGDSWFPFDQLDYIAGGLLLSSLIVDLSLQVYVWTVVLWFGLHMAFSYLGFLLKLKAKPI